MHCNDISPWKWFLHFLTVLCMHTHTHIHIHVCLHLHLHIHMHVHTDIYTVTYAHVPTLEFSLSPEQWVEGTSLKQGFDHELRRQVKPTNSAIVDFFSLWKSVQSSRHLGSKKSWAESCLGTFSWRCDFLGPSLHMPGYRPALVPNGILHQSLAMYKK